MPVNHRIASVLDSEYDLTRAKVKFLDLTLPEVAGAIQGKKIQALLVVTPISGRYLTIIRNFFPRDAKKSPDIAGDRILRARLQRRSAPMKVSIFRKARFEGRRPFRTTT